MNIRAKLTLNLMNYSFAGKTNLEASSRRTPLCSLNWLAGTSFIQVSHSHSPSLSSPAMVCKSLIVTGSMSMLEFNGSIYNTDEPTISFNIGIVYPFFGRSIAINLRMPSPPQDAFANSNAPFCDFNLNKFLNSIICVPSHLQKL